MTSHRTFRTARPGLTFALLAGILLFVNQAAAQANLPGTLPDHRVLLPNGWILSPAGTQATAGDFPMNFDITPDGNYAVAVNNGQGDQSLTVVDIPTWKPVQTLPVHASWLGIRFYDDGKRLAVSGGNDNMILLYDFEKGKAKLSDSVVLGKPWPDEKIWVAGIDIDEDAGMLYTVTKENNKLVGIDLKTREIAFATPLSAKGYTTLASRRRPVVYATVWGASVVAVADKKTGSIQQLIPVGSHPNAMAESPDGMLLYVANGNENTVSVIDADKGKVVETLSTSLLPGSPEGSTPNGLAVSPDGKTLLIANADNNFLAVIDVSRPGSSRPQGFIPTGWYPTAVRFTPDGKRIIVANGKGSTSFPNPGGPNPLARQDHEQYIGSLMVGTMSRIDVPSESQLAEYSALVAKNTPSMRVTAPTPGLAAITTDSSRRAPIRHVFYIIKENRTYDQVFGDIREGNGDSSLCIFGEQVTPNHHALVKQFVLLDNFYCDAEVSADGHNWSMAAYANDYVEKSWPTSYGGRGGEYEFEGGFPIAYPDAGFLWDNCSRHGVTYRTYGEFAENGKNPGDPAIPTMESLRGHVAPWYTSWDLDFSDLDRVKQWKKEFDSLDRAGAVPQFQIIKLPNDHTAGSRKGSLTPRAYVAQNDAALGQIVERISHSSVWKESAIFAIEDDAQNGADHVDAHRTVALAISPYTKHGFVDHRLYSTSSMVRTMEMILGLPPLSQYDATANPMDQSFTPEPDLSPYIARAPKHDIEEKNIAGAYGQEESGRMDFTMEDRAPGDLLNAIIWKSVFGASAPVPAPVHSVFVRPVRRAGDDGD